MKLKIKKLNPNAVIPFKTHDNDFCYDCVAVSREELAPNIYKYGLGFAYEMVKDNGSDNIINDIDIRPRSSVWKTGMILSNCIGTGDEPYRGELSVVFYHIFPNMPKYEVGDKIAQICIGTTEKIDFEEVNELGNTDRGTGGFGSTGK